MATLFITKNTKYYSIGFIAIQRVGHQFDQHLVKAALHAKFDEHKERDTNPIGRWDTYQNEIFSLGLEDRQIKPLSRLVIAKIDMKLPKLTAVKKLVVTTWCISELITKLTICGQPAQL